MKYGKRVCQSLKVVRKQIADANEIPYEITECPHQGNCPGTCPKCESELRYIENQLSLRRAAGKAISLVGLSLSISAAFSACGTDTASQPKVPEPIQETDFNDIEDEGEIVIASDEDLPEDWSHSEGEAAEPNQVFSVVEQQPEFPGGEAALMKFIKKNLRYPEQCLKNNIQGRVILTFIIEKDGSIDNIEVLRFPAKELSEEAVRIVKSMPKWIPGSQRGETVRVKYVLPIEFKLEDTHSR